MILPNDERDQRINSFLYRKFKEFDMLDETPTIGEIKSYGPTLNFRSTS